MADVVVVGAGLGGLAASIELAAAGHSVVVLEAAPRAGGKAGTVMVDGVELDTGPSVLTMPEVLGGLLGRAGMALGTDLRLRSPDPAFRYRWPDGTVLDLHPEVERSLDAVGATLGADARDDLERFLQYARRTWDVAAPRFVMGPPPTFGQMLTLGWQAVVELLSIDPFRTMNGAARRLVREPRLLDVLLRYATYNGSDPRRAPATLHCIAHVEVALGGFGVEGGIYRIVEVLLAAAARLGVQVQTGARVSSLRLSSGRIAGVRLDGGGERSADAVVVNADAAHLTGQLLPPDLSHGLPVRGTPSMSGWTALYRARRETTPRPAHEVLFPQRYLSEFVDIFDRDDAPHDPTVYICAQESCHGRRGWEHDEPLFVMANAPAEPEGASRPTAVWEALADRVRERLLDAGRLQSGDRQVWQRTPADLAVQFPGSRGALYGLASNSPFSAFWRPPNEAKKVPGLYLASGSAHPGGGMPLAMLSGIAAANAFSMRG